MVHPMHILEELGNQNICYPPRWQHSLKTGDPISRRKSETSHIFGFLSQDSRGREKNRSQAG
jgi:hypothetical protein